MSAMVNLEVPWINVMSKMDLVSAKSPDPAKGRISKRRKRNLARYVSYRPRATYRRLGLPLYNCRYLDPDPMLLASRIGEPESNNPRFHSLNQAIVQLVRRLDHECT